MEGRQTSSVGDARPEGEDGSPALLFHIFPSPATLVVEIILHGCNFVVAMNISAVE